MFAAVDPKSNDLPRTKLEPTTTNVLYILFLSELREKQDINGSEFLVDDSTSLQTGCERNGLDLRYEKPGNRNGAERLFREVKRRTHSFSNSRQLAVILRMESAYLSTTQQTAVIYR